MKHLTQIVAVTSVAVAAFIAGAGYAKSKAEFINMAADQMKFVDLAEAKGVSTIDVRGDSSKGAHVSLVKFVAGTSVPLHIHSHNDELIVLAGTMVFTTKDGTETRLGPGSYRFEPAGLAHATACAAGADCEIASIQSAAFDVKMVGDGK